MNFSLSLIYIVENWGLDWRDWSVLQIKLSTYTHSQTGLTSRAWSSLVNLIGKINESTSNRLVNKSSIYELDSFININETNSSQTLSSDDVWVAVAWTALKTCLFRMFKIVSSPLPNNWDFFDLYCFDFLFVS